MKPGYACINLTLKRTFRTLRLATLQAQGPEYLQLLVNEKRISLHFPLKCH